MHREKVAVLCAEQHLMLASTEGLLQSRFLGCGKTLAGKGAFAL